MNKPLRAIDRAQLAELQERARQAPRHRANLNLHEGDGALLHRILMGVCPQSYVRPHRHNQAHKMEMVIILDGQMDWLFFDEAGHLTARVPLQPGGEIRTVEVPPGIFHAAVARAAANCFLEVKQGPYDAATDKEWAPWSPAEGTPEGERYRDWMMNARIGEQYKG